MAFTLRVIFDGVFAFVPNEPFFEKCGDTWEAGEASQTWVLAPDLRQPDLADWDRSCTPERPHFRSSHLATLSTSPAFVTSKDKNAFDRRLASHDGSRKRLVKVLQRGHLSFSQNGTVLGGGLTPNVTVPRTDHQIDPDTPGTTEAERHSIWWLPRLAEVAPDYAHAAPSLKPSLEEPNPKPKALAFTMSLNAGTLAVTDHNRQKEDIRTWRFSKAKRNGASVEPGEEKPQQKWKRAIGNIVTWTTRIQSSYVELTIRENVASRTIKLWPPFCGRREVVLRLRNREPEHLFTREGKSLINFDVDFQTFYSMGQPSCETPTRRYPFFPGAPIGDSDKPCAGGTFQGFAGDRKALA